MNLDAVYIIGLDDGEIIGKFECTIGMFYDDVCLWVLKSEFKSSVCKSGWIIVIWYTEVFVMNMPGN